MNHPDHPPLWRPSAALLALLLVISPLLRISSDNLSLRWENRL